jgi:nuclear pore complex protein Nup205
LNDDFTKQAMFLSDQLDLDEFEAARLLLSGISSASTMNSSALDASVYLYHEERNYVLTILNVILENVKDETVEPAIRTVYTQFMADLIEEQGSYVSKILNSVKGLSVMISSLSKTGQLKSVNPAQPQQAQPQQAQSQMFQQPQQPIEEPIKFGSDTTALRIDRLTDERIYLAQVLYHICSLYWIAEPELMALLTYVQSISLSNATCSYVLIALMSALSTTRQKQLSANSFIGKNDYVTKLHESIMTKAYKVSTLKASVQIQWSLSIADMNKLGHTVTMNKTTIAEEAIKSDAFGFMNDYLLYFKQNKLDKIKKDTVQDMDLDDSTMAIDGLIVDPNDYHKFEAEICLDFQKFVVQELENTTRSFILNMSDFFRGLERVTTDELSAQEEDDKPLEQFLILLGSIYRNRLNAGLEFWQTSSALSTFVSWLLDYKFLNSLAGYFDFLAAIATGEQCAPLAHAMMKIGINTTDIYNSHLFSWGKLFGALQFYTKQYRERAAEDEPPTMAVHEEEPLCKFLNFCQQVIQYSDKARIAIWNEPVLDTHNSIVGLIGCPTSTRLRAALYNLLGAFCTNWGGGINQYGQKISFMVWNTLEHSDMVIPNKVMVQQAPSKAAITVPKPSITPANALFDNTFDNAATVSQRLQAQSVITQPVTAKPPKRNLTQFLPEQPAGFLREFEDEKSRRVYPETLAFLKLMASLIHTESKRDELISGFAPPKSSIPYCLGKDNHRSPGTAPYISLIVDHIFLNLKNQYYQYPENRWQLTDACLQVIENSIVSFDIEPIVDYVHCQNQKEPVTVVSFIEALDGNAAYNNAGIQDSEDLQQALLACVTHPGFDIVIRILSGGALIHELFKIVEMGRNAVTEKCKTKAGRNIDFKMCMTRCLRIFNKVFQLQNAFVNIFMPQLRATAKALPMGKYKLGPYEFPVPPPSLSSLGKHMLYNNEVIVQMALLINCEDEQDICRLSTSVLTWLTSEPEEYKLHVKFPDHINVPMGGIGSQIAGILISSHSAGEIILGFGERVHIDSAEITTYDDYEYDINVIPFWLAENTLNDVYRYKDDDPSRFASSVRVAILEMLLKTVEKDLPSPTMAEFLLGFNTSKDLEIKGFQYQAVSTDKRSRLACLYAILDLVHTGASDAEDQQETSVIVSHPVLAEKCYQLIYKLCARKSTSATMLQHLRNDGDFLTKQFTLIASRLENKLAVSQPHFEGLLVSADHARVRTDYLTMVSVLHQRAWMLQLIALELHQNRGSSTLLNLLYGGGSTKDIDVAEQLKGLSLELQGSYQQPLWNMVEILNSLDFTWIDGLDDGQEHKAPPTTSSTFKNFDAKRYIIKKDSYELYDIRAIFKVLRQYETNDVHTKTLSDQDRHALEFEMGNLLKQYMAENRHREISYGRLHCLRAWKQVVEITLSDCFDASFTFEYRERIIYDLLAVLLPKLHEDNALQSDMLKGLSEVILSLLTRLREDKRRQAVLKVGDSSVDVYELPADKLRNIFYLIVKSISKEKSTIEVRNTLYSSLVNVLQYITPDRSSHIIQLIREDHKLLGIICRDASFGREEFKATAFTVLESIYVLMGPQSTAAMHDCFAKDDFLKHTINMIKLSDDNLVTIIEKRDGKPIY